MTDKELLELAAKAAGIDLKFEVLLWSDGSTYPCYEDKESVSECANTTPVIRWNPLTDDGDALRLAVKLGMCITEVYYYYDARRQSPTTVRKSGGGMLNDIVVSFPTYAESFQQYDPYEATRRAIVRAAAEIGKSIK